MVVIIVLFMVVFVLCLQHLFTKRFCGRIENATPPQCSCSTPSPPSTSSQIAQFEETIPTTFRNNEEASSSSSSSSTTAQAWNYDVFLSFRGEDTRRKEAN
ncbi:hypothetical protein CMV_008257 [Castanea mollissima]|uniref:TIR domain-containing protein n=1 Tax=Castanea mollissima TaxID=60419 RepID=A0A8J4RMW5_9ROSI|nr:hypothetical protein CMV_008257 [Castanea mollissima]